MGALTIRALLLGVYTWVPDFLKLPPTLSHDRKPYMIEGLFNDHGLSEALDRSQCRSAVGNT